MLSSMLYAIEGRPPLEFGLVGLCGACGLLECMFDVFKKPAGFSQVLLSRAVCKVSLLHTLSSVAQQHRLHECLCLLAALSGEG